MRRFLTLFLLPLLFSCAHPEKISEKEVMDTFNEFYFSLDNDVDQIRNFVSDDYMIFEESRKWSTDEFIEYVKGFGKFESKREFKNMIINTDLNSAHITLEQIGQFELETPLPDGSTSLYYEWLESAYMVKENGKLKFKFYFSEQVND